MATKTKIVLDADVIIHFMKAGRFSLLPDIFPEYDYILLDVVYDEVTVHRPTKVQIDNMLLYFSGKLTKVTFDPKGDSRREYAILRSTLGKGESACMVYCRENQDVLGSSNLRDIKVYCERHRITYLTTLDFLYYAFIRNKMNKADIDTFIAEVVAKGSKLPQVNIGTYVPTAVI